MTDLHDAETPFPRPLFGGQVTALPSARVPARAVLTGQYVQLEPLDESVHGDALYAASHGSEAALEIWRYLPSGPWPSRAAYAAELRALSASQDRIFVAIRDRASGRVGGQASFMDMRPVEGVIEIGYIWFGLELRRTRAATEAMYLMLEHAMTELGYRRMQWRCNALNAGSRNAARRLGFRFEGIFYNHMIYKGRNRDTAWYSILDDEWPQVREILRAWLAADNFDADGRALGSLTERMAERGPSRRSSGE